MKILLVEDELDLRKALANVFKNNNYETTLAIDGLDALDKLKENTFDVIVLDVLMPRLDGFKTIKLIREKGITTPVLFLSALGEVEDKCKGLQLGGDDYLSKPFSMKELIVRIETLARRSSGLSHDISNFNGVILDFSTYQISYNSKCETLSLKEMEVLKLLFINHNLVVESMKIFEEVWGLENDSDLSIVWVYISFIRKKLLKIDAPVKIKVIRGIGYKLVNIDD